MDAAHATMTQSGTSVPRAGKTHAGQPGWPPCPAATKATSASVMIPIDFWASFDP